MVTSKCRNIKGDDWRAVDERMRCLIDEGRLEVYDVSADFDDSHKTGEQQVNHAMVVVGDDVFEMNFQAKMPNGINMWTGEVWQYDDFRQREEQRRIDDVGLIPSQMKSAIWDRFTQED